MLPQDSRLKSFVRDWLLPPEFYDRVLRFRTQQVHKRTHTDSRRYWEGEPLPTLSANVPLFLKAGVKSQTLTFQRESRCATSLERGQELKLEISAPAPAEYQIGFAWEGTPQLGEAIQVMVNGKPAARLEYLLPGQWHNVKVTLPAGKSQLVFQHDCAGTVHVSHPARLERYVEAESAAPKNIIFLILDSLIPDCVGLYGKEPSCTPCIDQYFREGAIFENAFSQSEWTYPSVHSMFTGYAPLRHDSNDPNSPGGGMPEQGCGSLAEQLRGAGYTTMGYSSVKAFCPAYYAHLGFDRFFSSPYWTQGPSHQVMSRQAVVQMEGNRAGKNFIFLHYLESHEPWLTRTELSDIGLSNFRITDPNVEYDSLKKGQGETKSEPFFEPDAVALFNQRRQARMREMDLSVSEILHYLKASGQDRQTLVVLMSDHGYNYLQQKQPLLCDSKVHTPLLIAGPGVKPGRYAGLVANNLDLWPTLLHAAGVHPEKRDGVVMLPLGGERREFVISESLYGKTYQVAVRSEEWVYHFRCAFDKFAVKIKLQENAQARLFRRNEERACRDLSAEFPAEATKLRQVLDRHLARRPDRIER